MVHDCIEVGVRILEDHVVVDTQEIVHDCRYLGFGVIIPRRRCAGIDRFAVIVVAHQIGGHRGAVAIGHDVAAGMNYRRIEHPVVIVGGIIGLKIVVDVASRRVIQRTGTVVGEIHQAHFAAAGIPVEDMPGAPVTRPVGVGGEVDEFAVAHVGANACQIIAAVRYLTCFAGNEHGGCLRQLHDQGIRHTELVSLRVASIIVIPADAHSHGVFPLRHHARINRYDVAGSQHREGHRHSDGAEIGGDHEIRGIRLIGDQAGCIEVQHDLDGVARGDGTGRVAVSEPGGGI